MPIKSRKALFVCTKLSGMTRSYWYAYSSKEGVASAQLNLATHYEGGDGIDQNFKEAVEWLQ